MQKRGGGGRARGRNTEVPGGGPCRSGAQSCWGGSPQLGCVFLRSRFDWKVTAAREVQPSRSHAAEQLLLHLPRGLVLGVAGPS